jgi:glycosyltransferase involved in cell wall biosynthesis
VTAAAQIALRHAAPDDPVDPATARVKRVLVLTNGWPTPDHPEYAVFSRRQMDDLAALGIDYDVEFVNARDRGKAEYLRRLPHLARRARDADLVHCFHGLSLLLATLGGVRKPMVVSYLNALENEFLDLPGPLRVAADRMSRGLLRRGRMGLIFKDRLPDWLKADPLARYIPNGVKLDGFEPGDRAAARAALGLPADALLLLFVSSKSLDRPQKRHDRFREVLAAMRARHPGRTVEALTLVAEPFERVKAFYHAADVHVMTSDFEGSPNSVKEAMASALPVVATDVGNVRLMVDGLAAARVVAPFAVEGFCDAIDAVTAAGREAELALRDSLIAQGLDAATVARKVRRLYEDVAASG